LAIRLKLVRKDDPSGPARDADDGGRRRRQNVIALCIVAALLLAGLWLFAALRTYLQIESCIEQGLRNCDSMIKDKVH
jgi:hypothetical protein